MIKDNISWPVRVAFNCMGVIGRAFFIHAIFTLTPVLIVFGVTDCHLHLNKRQCNVGLKLDDAPVVAALMEEVVLVHRRGDNQTSSRIMPTLSGSLRFGPCRRKTDEEKASVKPLISRNVTIEEYRRIALTDKVKTQGMSEQGVSLYKLRKTIQTAVKANGGPVSCIVVEEALKDMSKGPVKDKLILVLRDPDDSLPHSHLLNGHVYGKARSHSACWFDWVIMFFCLGSSHTILVLFHA
jgi:hypothetical protein